MSPTSSSIPDDRPSRHAKPNSTKPCLAVDTSFSRHKGHAPRQLFPSGSRTQELTFISLSDAKALKKEKKGGLKQQLESRLHLRPSAQRSVSDNISVQRVLPRSAAAAVIPESAAPIGKDSLQPPAIHKRIKGLRPSPLDLSHDVSPSDRAITIGLSVPSAGLKADSNDVRSSPKRQPSDRRAEEAQTPTIVITPAKEDFGVVESPEELSGYRPASSVYSRYTNGGLRNIERDRTPPVPPLPLFVNRTAPRASAVTIFEEDADGDLPFNVSKRSTSQSHLPTPRRSRGWWNVITSPFSAASKSGSNAFFWRSNSMEEDDHARILDDAAGMGEHDGVIFTNRAPGDDELRTALPLSNTEKILMPERSDTAPGALDANVAPVVNIYRVPSQGLAAAYYNPNTRFPSVIVGPTGTDRGLQGGYSPLSGATLPGDERDSTAPGLDSVDGWSPSQSVARFDGDRRSIDASETDASEKGEFEKDSPGSGLAFESRSIQSEPKTTGTAPKDPFAEPEAATSPLEMPDAPSATRNIFSTPSEGELYDTTPVQPSAGYVAATSYFSPSSATPVVEHAHMATFMGPNSANGEPRLLTPGPPSPPPARGLGEATMAHREVESFFQPVVHEKTGLGISDAGDEKMGSSIVETRDLEGRPRGTPWYRRFRWILVFVSAFLVMLSIVLVIVLIPLKPSGKQTPVEAAWLNLTGFPPMPTGIMTVIRPAVVDEVSGCVADSSSWSCEEQPSYRFVIYLRNGTVASNETQIARRGLYTADPAAPSTDDQVFLGRYTDNVTAPYDGEETPFYLSLLNATALGDGVKLRKRSDPYPYPTQTDGSSGDASSTRSSASLDAAAHQTSSSSTSGSASALSTSSSTTTRTRTLSAIFSTSASTITHTNPYPYPSSTQSASNSSSTTTSTNTTYHHPSTSHGEGESYPYPEAQPLRLYNRGRADEYYGFYTYFDRSTSSSSNEVCIWTQSRLHIQIWTQKPSVSNLIDNAIPLQGLAAENSTANDMTAPGSFPYSVTITLDRHGGKAGKKGTFCRPHGAGKGAWVDEDRGFGGTIVNPALFPTSGNGTELGRRDGGYGGIDGGSGGCMCSWQN